MTSITLPGARAADGRLTSPVHITAVQIDAEGADWSTIVIAAFDIYSTPVLLLPPPNLGYVWQIAYMQGATSFKRVVTFSDAPVNLVDLPDIDVTTLIPVPSDPAIPEWNAILQQFEQSTDEKIAAHIDAPTPHPAYDDMADLSILFENVSLVGPSDDAADYIPDLSTTFTEWLA